MSTTTLVPAREATSPALNILLALSFSHFLNDMFQSLIPATYPMLKTAFNLDFMQIGLITLASQLTASLLQPLIGLYTDKRHQPYSLAVGMTSTFAGLAMLAAASSYVMVVVAAAMVGTGSAVFHPESSRAARAASGGRFGFAQSLFQVGGNCGSSVGPLVAAFIVLPNGQGSIAWFLLAAVLAIAVLIGVGNWTKSHAAAKRARSLAQGDLAPLDRRRVILSLAVLMALVFSKFFYMASMNNYFTFYLMNKFALSVRNAQIHLFIFLAAVAAGTFLGGPLGDRFGRKYVIWGSILGVLPFTLVLPYVDLFWTGVLSVVIGLILSSAFAAIVVYAQELMPGKVGTVAGLFFGLSFGMAAVGAAVLGELADLTSITFVYKVCAFLPAIGFLAWFLPNTHERQRPAVAAAA